MKGEKQTNPFKPQLVENISKRSWYCEMYEGSKCWAENSFCHYMWRILTEKSILLVYTERQKKREINKTHDRPNSVSGMICQLKRKRIIVCFFRLFLIFTLFSLYKEQFIHILGSLQYSQRLRAEWKCFTPSIIHSLFAWSFNARRIFVNSSTQTLLSIEQPWQLFQTGIINQMELAFQLIVALAAHQFRQHTISKSIAGFGIPQSLSSGLCLT